MQFLARFMMIATFVAFAASSVAHSAGSAWVASGMIAADVEMTTLADCKACDDDSAGASGIACDFVCNSGTTAAVVEASVNSDLVAVPYNYGMPIARDFRGLTSQPAKQPPRFLL